MKKTLILLAIAALPFTPARADARGDLMAQYAAEAGVPFSADRGEALFRTEFNGGKPETPACTTCHTKSPKGTGKTRAGKLIEPLALSATPTRYGDAKKVEKWFGRNCRSVLGRTCTATEKGDFLTFMMSQ
ncbi:DUF1924 domain-containing protein [Magnetospira sp. QH-2]|uniref:DUF1924 domain-containing protein n=1 Tax=Magnetospira sp. (strain QH-2) TaxID=1288970 RepID=UPI0003E81598|nr:DUF1924 domain-containing protein [Magnetospira sp. QH-2]CCQ75061.1 Cytochrome c-type protein SHP [Magnetospira sp. QH-2]